MSAAAKLGQPHGMLSIIGLDDKTLEEICSKVRDKMGGSIVCQLANYLFPTGRVVSGHKDALNQVQVESKLLICGWKLALKPIITGIRHSDIVLYSSVSPN